MIDPPKLIWDNEDRKSVILIKNIGTNILLKAGDMIEFHYDYKIIGKILGFTFIGPYSQPNGLLFTEYKNGVWDEWTIRKKKLHIHYNYSTWNSIKKMTLDPPPPPSNFDIDYELL